MYLYYGLVNLPELPEDASTNEQLDYEYESL